jgi:hypothetical protein
MTTQPVRPGVAAVTIACTPGIASAFETSSRTMRPDGVGERRIFLCSIRGSS